MAEESSAVDDYESGKKGVHFRSPTLVADQVAVLRIANGFSL